MSGTSTPVFWMNVVVNLSVNGTFIYLDISFFQKYYEVITTLCNSSAYAGRI